jgi:transposase-like protein
VSVASVARRFEVNDSAIYYWRKRYGRPNDESVAASPNFVPIVVYDDGPSVDTSEAEQAPSPNSWGVTISMRSDRCINIDGAFELPDLIKLLRGMAA